MPTISIRQKNGVNNRSLQRHGGEKNCEIFRFCVICVTYCRIWNLGAALLEPVLWQKWEFMQPFEQSTESNKSDSCWQ